MLLALPLVVALGACGGSDVAEPKTPEEEDTMQKMEEAGEAVGEEVEGAAEDVGNAAEDVVDGEDSPDDEY